MEQFQQPDEHLGEKYLNLLGLGHMAGDPVLLSDGRQIAVRDFLEVCGEHATAHLEMLADLDDANPAKAIIRDGLKGSVLQRLNLSPEA